MTEALTTFVEDIPLLTLEAAGSSEIVIHVPAFGQKKEDTIPVLRHFVTMGFTSIAIDAYQHGARGTEDRATISRRVFANFRREMWPIIGETTIDVMKVAKWARHQFGPVPLHLTGLSMGGDIVVAAAPFVEDLASVNAIVATPDWRRHGMRDIERGIEIDQGESDRRARFFFDSLNPIDHVERYGNTPIRFVIGEKDTHVPPEAAYRFAKRINGSTQSSTISVIEKVGLSHMDFVQPIWLNDLTF